MLRKPGLDCAVVSALCSSGQFCLIATLRPYTALTALIWYSAGLTWSASQWSLLDCLTRKRIGKASMAMDRSSLYWLEMFAKAKRKIEWRYSHWWCLTKEDRQIPYVISKKTGSSWGSLRGIKFSSVNNLEMFCFVFLAPSFSYFGSFVFVGFFLSFPTWPCNCRPQEKLLLVLFPCEWDHTAGSSICLKAKV